ncbi:MAG: hypothetical protein ACKOWE_06675, partial [Micrococcales bacterium]
IPAANFGQSATESTQVTYQVTDVFGQNTSAPQKVTVTKQPLATLNGTVFLDMNKNGFQDPNEPGMPGIEVTATNNTTPAAIYKPVALRAASASGRRVGVAAVGQYTVITDRLGNYSFTVAPASYKLSAVLKTTLVSKSTQGDPANPETGAVDWSLTTPEIPAGANITNDFGAAGTGSMAGTVIINGTAPIPHATIQCMWGGFDGIIGSSDTDPYAADDLLITGTADDNGNFVFDGIPGGAFECKGKDPVTNQESTPTRASVDQYSGKPSFVTLPLRKAKRAVFTITGFPAGRPTFTASMKRQLRANMARYAAQGKIYRLSIDGFTMGPTILQVDHKLSLDRARAAWSLIQTQDNTIQLIGYRGIQDYQVLGKKVRRVTVTLYFY